LPSFRRAALAIVDGGLCAASQINAKQWCYALKHARRSVEFSLNRPERQSAAPNDGSPRFDLLVVGGGINGAGIARDAAGRGLKVLLCEKDDLAAHTSSASTKLIHGGLRYLELYDFGLVRKALKEREVLLAAAPHLMWPLSFVIPHDESLRPAWIMRCGLFLYDHLARRRLLPASETLDLRTHEAGAPLTKHRGVGFRYWDGWVDDARLVVANAIAAHELGAVIRTRTECTRLLAHSGEWHATLTSHDGTSEQIRARAAVNAAGPWAARFLQSAATLRSAHGLRLVKGSHIVVPSLFSHDHAYLLQADDRRIVFAIPYEHDFTLIGTTDVDYEAEPESASISADEVSYLCALSNRYFKQQIAPKDVVWSYSGVRPLLEDESSDARTATRDFALELLSAPAPLLSVFGGKITTYRALAEAAMERLAPVLGCSVKGWTAAKPLPGGDLPAASFAAFESALALRHPWLPPDLRHRYARAYGTRAEVLLAGAAKMADLGAPIAPGLYEGELEYLCRNEWALTAEDVLWRRSKLGLRARSADIERVQRWLAARQTQPNQGAPAASPLTVRT
jgi:glycerol-3-phosphate dehydrogenase